MSYDENTRDDEEINTLMMSYAIVGIIMGAFTIISLILGCIMYACCKKPPRRGFIISNNTGGQPGNAVAGASGAIEQHPPTHV